MTTTTQIESSNLNPQAHTLEYSGIKASRHQQQKRMQQLNQPSMTTVDNLVESSGVVAIDEENHLLSDPHNLQMIEDDYGDEEKIIEEMSSNTEVNQSKQVSRLSHNQEGRSHSFIYDQA